MSFFPGEKLRYAETHFKFKLPWSFLYKPWPEIIFDMPFQIVPGITPTIWIVVRDADKFPSTLENVQLKICGGNQERIEKISLNKKTDTAFDFVPIPVPELTSGHYKIYPEISVSRNGERKTFLRWNLPGLKPAPLCVQILSENPPKAPGFAAGEMHCHTYYSKDHVEYGASPKILQEAAKAVGLDFVSLTDHAYDFAFTDEDYTKEAASPLPRFNSLKKELEALPKSPLMLAGEEVSAGNSKGENVHVVVMDADNYLPGLGDCGRYWLDNKPTRKVSQILDSTQSHCFAAHPFQQMGLLEKFIFRRGYWTHDDLNLEKKEENKKHSIRGIQFWNGIRDEGFMLGREFWINELGKGNFLLPIAGNDAHGDLNDTTAVSLPLVSLKRSTAHVFGKVQTVVKILEKEAGDSCEKNPSTNKIKNLTPEILKDAFNKDCLYITNGPALWWERIQTKDSSKAICFHAQNTDDYGRGFRYVRIYGRRNLGNGKFALKEEICIESLIAAPGQNEIIVRTDNFAYLRAECETADGHFALTSAAQII